MKRELSPTRADMIRDDVQYALEEAYSHVEKFFGSPKQSRKEKGHLDYEEDKRFKEIAFGRILSSLLGVNLAWTFEEVET